MTYLSKEGLNINESSAYDLEFFRLYNFFSFVHGPFKNIHIGPIVKQKSELSEISKQNMSFLLVCRAMLELTQWESLGLRVYALIHGGPFSVKN